MFVLTFCFAALADKLLQLCGSEVERILQQLVGVALEVNAAGPEVAAWCCR